MNSSVENGGSAYKGGHTPGPWQCYADLPSVEPNWHIVTNASRMRVLANVHIEPGNATDRANADLIVAAPDILADLRAAEAVLMACEATFCDLINTLDHDEDCPWWDEEHTTPEAENLPACGCWKRGVEIMLGNVREVLSGQKDAITKAEAAK